VSIFFDNTFSIRAVQCIRLLRQDSAAVPLIHLQDEFSPDTKDIEWIPAISQKQYRLITADGRIRKGSAERAALDEAGIPTMFVYSGFTNLTIWKQTAWLMDHWERIEEKLLKLKPHEIRHINANGSVTTYEEMASKRQRNKK